MCGNKKLIKLLEDAKTAQSSIYPSSSHELQGTPTLPIRKYNSKMDLVTFELLKTERTERRKCTVFPFHPHEAEQELSRKHGVVVWIPSDLQKLVVTAAQELGLSDEASFVILSKEEGRITDIDMISEGQKLYLISDTADQI